MAAIEHRIWDGGAIDLKPGRHVRSVAVIRTLELSVNLRSSKRAKRKGCVRTDKENAEHQ